MNQKSDKSANPFLSYDTHLGKVNRRTYVPQWINYYHTFLEGISGHLWPTSKGPPTSLPQDIPPPPL